MRPATVQLQGDDIVALAWIALKDPMRDLDVALPPGLEDNRGSPTSFVAGPVT